MKFVGAGLVPARFVLIENAGRDKPCPYKYDYSGNFAVMPYRKSPNQRVSFVFFIARVLACALLCSIYNISVRAQSSITHIVGIVQDQARSPISQAEVLLKNQSTRIAEATTDLDGRFKIDAVVTENATLTVRAQGFA